MAQKIFKRTDLVKGGDEQIVTVGTLRVVYRDIFNLKYIYLLMHEWFIDNNFVSSRADEDFPEVMFVHRDFGPYKQLWWRWRFEKPSPNGKYLRWCIDIDMQILGHKVVETVINGQKMKVDSAEVEVFVAPALYLRTSDWKKNFLLELFTPALRWVIYRDRIEKDKKEFEQVVWECQEAIKTYLKLETYLPERQGHEFHAKVDMQG